MTLTKTTDHVTEALEHFVEQFKGKPNLSALMTAFVNQVQDLEDACYELYTERWIDTAVGVQLDGLGAIVGEDREGRGDEEYRLAIKAQIQINFSEATPEDILTALTNFHTGTYELIETGYAAFIARLIDAWDPDTDPSLEDFVALLNSVNGAGIAAWFQYTLFDDDDTFTFASGDTEETSTTQGFADTGLFAAVAIGGTDQVMTSPDGVTWTSRAEAEANQWRDICWSPELDLFAAVSSNGTNRVMTSPDGITWTSRFIFAVSWYGITWSPELGLFAAVGSSNVATSPDGITWTVRTVAEANEWRAITWSPELSLFAAVSIDGTNRVMTSPDGITWTARTAAAANQWVDITWSPELSLFAAVSIDGTNRVMTSPDGITWTARVAAAANTWQGITWTPDLELFVAVSNAGTDRVMTSPDGINWLSRSAAAANSWNDVIWGEYASTLVGVASTGTNLVMTSSDSIFWSGQTEAETTTWQDIAYSDAKGGHWAGIIGGTG
jgi:hypothetical protein